MSDTHEYYCRVAKNLLGITICKKWTSIATDLEMDSIYFAHDGLADVARAAHEFMDTVDFQRTVPASLGGR